MVDRVDPSVRQQLCEHFDFLRDVLDDVDTALSASDENDPGDARLALVSVFEAVSGLSVVWMDAGKESGLDVESDRFGLPPFLRSAGS